MKGKYHPNTSNGKEKKEVLKEEQNNKKIVCH